jgi:glycosyltransferase involved in cell wall biosynthesis
VVIPAYNAEQTIHETLESVRSQTYRNLEILIVDDGSTDGTARLVERHRAADQRIILLSQSNGGVAAARNTGWQAAHAEFIAFVDADDLWSRTKIEKQMRIMLVGAERVALIYTWFVVIDQRSHILGRGRSRRLEGDVLQHIVCGNFVGHGSSPLVRRSVLEELGGFDESLRAAGAQGCEDLQLYQRIAERYYFGLVPEYLAGYRVGALAMSSDRVRMLRSYRLVAEEARRAHPELGERIDAGIRQYFRFLILEAVLRKELKQAWAVMATQVPNYPVALLSLPMLLITSGTAACLRRCFRVFVSKHFE